MMGNESREERESKIERRKLLTGKNRASKVAKKHLCKSVKSVRENRES